MTAPFFFAARASRVLVTRMRVGVGFLVRPV